MTSRFATRPAARQVDPKLAGAEEAADVKCQIS